jgi:outer membrane autotransporter protein
MKSNKLLAKSITLGLILAIPYGVVSAEDIVISSDTTYSGPYNAENGGVQISSGVTLSGDENTDMEMSGKFTGFPRALQVNGTIKTANSLTVNGGTYVVSGGTISDIDTVTFTNTVNSHSGGGLAVSFDNQGILKNVDTLVLGGRTTNTGTISVGAINKADDGTTLDIGNQAGGKIEVTGTANVDQLGNSGEIKAGTINLTASGNNGIHNQTGGKITAGEITGSGYIHNSGGTIDADTIDVKLDITNTNTIITDKITADSLQNDGTIKTSEDAGDNVLGELNVRKFTNSGTLTVTNANVSESVTNSGTLTLDKIGSAENLVNIRNQSNGNLTVNGDVFGNFYNGGNIGTMTVKGTVTGYGYFAGNENVSGTLTADKLIATANDWNAIYGEVNVNNMDVNGTMGVYTDDLNVADTTNINADLQFRAESGNSKLNNVNLNNASLQVGGESLTITGDMNVTGSEARFETYYGYDNNKSYDKAIKVEGKLTVEEGASLLITDGVDAGEGSSFEANNIILENGATLENGIRETGSGLTSAFGDFTVKTLTGNNSSIINEGKMNIGTLSGKNNNITVDSLVEAQVKIDTNNSTGLQVTGTSEATSQFNRNDLAGSLQDLADTVSIGSGNQLDSVIAQESDIIGETTALVDEYGNIIANTVIEKGHIANEGITELANVAFMAWRAENDEMHQRMGELRSSNGEAGIWARMKRGESKYGDMDIKNQYSTYQLGYDEKVGDSNWYIGGAISRTEGKSSFATGSGENQSTGFTVYGTYVADDGQYVDLSAKYARLDNEFDVFGRSGIESTGDYRNNGYAFSAEYGKRIEAGNDFWVEPQVQLTYGHLSSANYTTSRNVRVTQDAMDSVVGRLGFAAGKDIGAGNVYVKASYLYDFDGDTNVKMTDGKNSAVYDQDLGGGWFEVGIGTNINLSETSHLYFDVEKTYGGDIETPWQWNAGVRFDF